MASERFRGHFAFPDGARKSSSFPDKVGAIRGAQAEKISYSGESAKLAPSTAAAGGRRPAARCAEGHSLCSSDQARRGDRARVPIGRVP